MPAPAVSAILHESTAEVIPGKTTTVLKYRVATADPVAAIAAAPGTVGVAGVTRKACESILQTSPAQCIVSVTTEIIGANMGYSYPDQPVIEYDTWEYKRTAVADFSATPKLLENKAKDAFEIEVSSHFPRVKVTKKTSGDKAGLLQYVGHINTSAITVGSLSIPAKRGMLTSVRSYSSGEGETLQWFVSFEILVNNYVAKDGRIGWFTDIANRGWNELVDGSRKAHTENKVGACETWLDATSGAATTTPNYITFQLHPDSEMDFV